jgi:hypothetical protein
MGRRAGHSGQSRLCLLCLQEEESPCGEVTLKRDRSFSEHDLALLQSEVVSGLQPASQPPGGMEPPRPRAGSVHTWRPSTRDQGKSRLSFPAHPSLRSDPPNDLLASVPALSEQEAPQVLQLLPTGRVLSLSPFPLESFFLLNKQSMFIAKHVLMNLNPHDSITWR